MFIVFTATSYHGGGELSRTDLDGKMKKENDKSGEMGYNGENGNHNVEVNILIKGIRNHGE